MEQVRPGLKAVTFKFYQSARACPPFMPDHPAFSITEFVARALLLACAVLSLIYTGKLVYDANLLGAMQSGGLGIVLLVAVADPVNYW